MTNADVTAHQLLEEARDDPREWPPIDVHKLLDLWEFEYRSLGEDADRWGAIVRYHPEHPDLNVVLMSEAIVAESIVLHVVRIIDTLISRSG